MTLALGTLGHQKPNPRSAAQNAQRTRAKENLRRSPKATETATEEAEAEAPAVATPATSLATLGQKETLCRLSLNLGQAF